MVQRGTGRVVVVGAGIGGLAAALDLAARGFEVLVLERAAAPGGKMREVAVGGEGGARLDAGPTVFTMRWVFEDLFDAASASIADHLTLKPATVLARHAWDGGGGRLDLFADVARSADAIGAFAGAAEARGFRAFCDRARRVYRALEGPFIRAARPTPFSLAAAAGPSGLAGLMGASPFTTLWRALGDHFRDPRLRQLFARYATYCGSSPFLAPATLMLVAHVEQEGVWLVEGGMHRLARSMEELARARGATFRYGAEVAEIRVESGRAAGVALSTGERLDAAAVLVNADAAAVASGLFGPAARGALPPAERRDRSLSALTWAMLAEVEGFPLLRHTVFFSDDYPSEFEALFGRRRLPAAPTTYVCAQDRGAAEDDLAPSGPERLLCLVNAPATGDTTPPSQAEIERCETATFRLLERCGLTLRRRDSVLTGPAGFEKLFPATGGALYGRASHGWAASFARPGARTALPGLYLAGGSAHPGAGVPMAALSGRLASSSIASDLAKATAANTRASTARSRATATPGGTWTR
ncbi:phytoene desaturase family protein [Craurococcus roseus]|uniref:Phytoene desaturase family protein n=1 Tax=Craurococcus roseus TaxID=77585 RepID=A0ABN1EY03_9PROT